jgi:two-component system sensor histidine kinase UhpB
VLFIPSFPEFIGKNSRIFQAPGEPGMLAAIMPLGACPESDVPLRVQLILSMVSALLISLLLVGTLAWWNAARSVNTELHAALDAGERIVRGTVAQLPATRDNLLYLERLIPVFDGNRHVKVALLSDGDVLAATSTMARTGQAPQWFATLVGVAPERRDVVLPEAAAPYRHVTLTSDPGNEIGEVWARARDDMVIMAMFCLAAVLLGRWVVAHAMRPLENLAQGIAVIGTGNYAARIIEIGPPEISGLASSFNLMAERLGELQAKNHRLTEQLLTIQEEERTDLARDLHDDVGPFLFAVNVDAAAIARTADANGQTEIVEQITSIQESVTHMQRHVRAILARLRPAGLQDIGLEQAVVNLAAFWQKRHPHLVIHTHITADTTRMKEHQSAAIYRLIQESLGNAVRHGQAHAIEVSVAEGDNEVVVAVVDDGVGLPQALPGAAPQRFGIIGMKERVAALGGQLVLENRRNGPGTIVTAHLPLARTTPAITDVN